MAESDEHLPQQVQACPDEVDVRAVKIEEYKRLYGMVIELEKQMVQVAGGAVALSVTILSAVAGLLLSREEIPVIAAYTALAAFLICIPAFALIISHRIDLCRAASYLRVFHHERVGTCNWETRLDTFRAKIRGEAHDPIPLALWAMGLAGTALYYYGLLLADATGLHLLVPAILLLVLGGLHYRYSRAIDNIYPKYVDVWRHIS